MTRPASVDALFAGHTLPKSKAALDEVREYIRGLERIKEAARAIDDYTVVDASTGRTPVETSLIVKMLDALQAHGDEA